jgi:hypothetical protein
MYVNIRRRLGCNEKKMSGKMGAKQLVSSA